MRSKRRPRFTYRLLHAQRARMVPSIALRQGYLEKVHLAQIKSEKDDILSHIGRLQPGVRAEYLRRIQRKSAHADVKAARNALIPGESSSHAFQEAKLRLEQIPKDVYNIDRIRAGRHADFLHTRDDALTDRIPKKAVGL